MGSLVRGSLDWPAEHRYSSIASGAISHNLVDTSDVKVAELNGFPHQLTLSQSCDVVGEERKPQILDNLPLSNKAR
jgi:hypothetical protein